MTRIKASKEITCGQRICAALFLCTLLTITASAQTFTSLYSFNKLTDGTNPRGTLVQGFNGSFYGTTPNGGDSGWGTVFEITPAGQFTTLYNFCSQPECTDGVVPFAGLVQGMNGNLYGTTGGHGANGGGTVFELTPTGQLTTLYNFCLPPNCPSGTQPYAGLIQVSNGNFYGTTLSGGANNGGTVFEITPAGKLTTLYSFCSQTNCSDGSEPEAGLVQAKNGNFYGSTSSGGTNHSGTIFEITSTGKLSTLYSFCPQSPCSDGVLPNGLVQGANGNFYGTTFSGGANDGGTIFEITPAGKLAPLYSFCSQPNCSDGEEPFAGLVLATNGNLYGTTSAVNINGSGTVFEITPTGKLTTLYSFCSQPGCSDGLEPYSGLMQATNGYFYGSTYYGGVNGENSGTIFRESLGLGPFVETLPTSGSTGTEVTILGNNLTDSTGVNFNGTAAIFTVISAAEIKAKVPNLATSGPVRVTTSTGTLASNTIFQVR
jgi:uncharacterized repeat protein (TIGR03803 family)